MYSAHNEGKSIVTGIFVRRLKNRNSKYMTSISKIVYIDKLDEIVNKYNNAYHSTTKMKPVDIKPSACIESTKDINYQDPKFKIGDIVRILEYKNVLTKGFIPIRSKEVFVIKKVKNTSVDICS